MEQYIDFPGLNIPDVPVKDYWEKRAIENLAQKVRDKWDIGGKPIVNIIFEMERKGIFISSIHANTQSIDVYSKKKVINGYDYYFMLLTNDKKSTVRRQFDA